MKKYAWLLLFVMMGMGFAGCDPCKENVFTGLGDKIATIGKDGLEKEKVLAERKAARASECAEKTAGDMKKKIGF